MKERDSTYSGKLTDIGNAGPMDIEILLRIASGHTDQEIAEELGRKQDSVEAEVRKIFMKIGTRNRFQAMLWAAKNLRNSDWKES